jgi:hypothetical protein
MRALVDAEALPREFGGSLRRALENNSPWQSRAVQSEILRVATQDELALVICSMPGIERAAVLYDVDDDAGGGLRGARVKTASVSVRTQPEADLDRGRIEAIRVLVAASIAGLTPDRVAVTDLRSGRVHAGPLDDDGSVAAVDPLLARAMVHERRLADKIRQAIAFVKGASVDVTVEFTASAVPPAAPPAPEPEALPASPPPLMAANTPAELPAATPPPAATPAAPAVPPTSAADMPVKVHVAIAVPESAIDAAPAAAARQLDRIREHVLELLPMTPDPANRRVAITTFAVPAVARRDGPPAAATTAAPTGNLFETPTANRADEPAADEISAGIVMVLRGLGMPVAANAPIPRQVWIAATSVCVGLLAAWMWWAGSRRRVGDVSASARPTIDWSQPHGRGPEPLDRVAA